MRRSRPSFCIRRSLSSSLRDSWRSEVLKWDTFKGLWCVERILIGPRWRYAVMKIYVQDMWIICMIYVKIWLAIPSSSRLTGQMRWQSWQINIPRILTLRTPPTLCGSLLSRCCLQCWLINILITKHVCRIIVRMLALSFSCCSITINPISLIFHLGMKLEMLLFVWWELFSEPAAGSESNTIGLQSEFKLGFIAQSCLAPGFSTLMSNLFAMRSDLSSPDRKRWQNEYLKVCRVPFYVIGQSKSWHHQLSIIRELGVRCTQRLCPPHFLEWLSVRLQRFATLRY